MKALRIVLVDTPSTGSDEAISRVRTLASGEDSKVTVLATVGYAPATTADAGIDVEALIRDEGQRRAEAIAADLRRSGVSATAKVRFGVPFIQAIEEAHETKADFVIKVSESLESKNSNIGATDLSLLRKCPCPVWITRRRERTPYERVFAAVDPSDDSQERDSELDARILNFAAEIARSDCARLTIVHAWEAFAEDMLRGRARFSDSEIQKVLNDTRETRERRIQELADACDLDGVEYDIRMIKGRPNEVIPLAVERDRADLLVMGTVVRTGIRGFFIGSTAEELIQQVGCAILALKPLGFVSPVLPA